MIQVVRILFLGSLCAGAPVTDKRSKSKTEADFIFVNIDSNTDAGNCFISTEMGDKTNDFDPKKINNQSKSSE